MLLWGLAALIPLILFLLRRRIPQQVEWGAMQFLAEASRLPHSRRRWKQWLLLTIRMFLPLLIALVAATPGRRDQRTSNALLATASTHWILIFDCSASMGLLSDGSSSLDLARQQAKKIVAEAPAGDIFSLLASGNDSRERSTLENADRASVLRQIANLNAGGNRFGAYSMLEAARSLIEQTVVDNVQEFRVVILSDFQEQDWPGFFPSLDVGRPFEIRLTPCRPTALTNVSLQQFQTNAVNVTRGQSFLCQTDAINDSQQPQNATVQLFVNGDSVGQRELTLQGGESQTISFEVTANQSGHMEVEAVLNPGGLLFDDRRFLTVAVRPEINVLCIEGRKGAAKSFVAATTALQDSRLPIISSVVAHPDQLARIDRESFDIVAIFDVASFSDAWIDSIRNFARSGGGALLSMGPQADIHSWSRLLEIGLSTGGLINGSVQLESETESGDFRYDPLDYQHPLVQDFKDQPQAGLIDVPIQRYYRFNFDSPENDYAAVLKYDSGDNALVSIAVNGQGRVLVSTTPLTPANDTESWNQLPAWWSYVPIVNNAVVWLFGNSSYGRNRQVGETLDVPLDENRFTDRVLVELPDQEPEWQTVSVTDDQTFVTITPHQPGFVRIRMDDSSNAADEILAFNVLPGESDMKPADMTFLRSMFPAKIESATNVTIDNRPTRSLPFYVAGLLTVIVLLVVEPWLANRNRKYTPGKPE